MVDSKEARIRRLLETKKHWDDMTARGGQVGKYLLPAVTLIGLILENIFGSIHLLTVLEGWNPFVTLVCCAALVALLVVSGLFSGGWLVTLFGPRAPLRKAEAADASLRLMVQNDEKTLAILRDIADDEPKYATHIQEILGNEDKML